ncbi:MAG: hypothetical protein ACRELT_17190 [Longimicrobiales bacterium]
MRADTLPGDTLPGLVQEPDTVLAPAVRFPAMPLAPHVSAAGTEWVWDRETLLRQADVSLIDLLERIPGVTTFRAGTFVQPEVASAFGGTAARTEIEIDGYVIDPLAGSTFDLSQLALGHLRELRVERHLGLLRIIITTEYPVEGQPYTRVEAGIGLPAANLFRGLFLVPHAIIGPLALGIERLDTDGIGRAEPAGLFTGWAKTSWTDGQRGVQLEWMRGTLRRERDSPWPTERMRQDLVLRARNEFAPGLVAEVYAGRSQLVETVPAADAESSETHTDRASVQAGARAGWKLPMAAFGASVRYRSEANLPVGEARLDAETALGPIRLAGEASVAAWDGGYTTSYSSLRGEIGRFLGAAAFGDVTMGSRGAPVWEDTVGDGILLSDRTGWRAGLSLDLGRASGTLAIVSLDQDFTRPFGLPFDRLGSPRAVESAQGIEAHGRVVLWPGYLTLSSWITDWREATNWTYLPSRSWRTALELHALPLASGNLEIFGRAEAHMRGSVLAFDPAPAEGSTGYVAVPAYTTADGYLQIRIIDVRIFIRWEDILGNFGREVEELPGRNYRGPRIFYGVKWNLWN